MVLLCQQWVMRQPSALPAQLAGRSFTLEQQVEAGVPAWRLAERSSRGQPRCACSMGPGAAAAPHVRPVIGPDSGGSLLPRHGRPAVGLPFAELCRVGSESVPETRLRLALGRVGLPEPALSYVVLDPTGKELAWPDMAFPEFKVAVNYNGRHHLEARQRESDIRRDESIAAAGWQPVTVTAGHVRTWGFDGCAHRVLDAMVRAGWQHRPGTSRH